MLHSNRNTSSTGFTLLVLGQIISVLGSALLRFALSLYVLDVTGRGDIYAALFAISNIPLLLSPLGGAIADRFNRRNLMVMFDFASSAVVLGLIVLLSIGNFSVVLIGVVMVLLGIISSMYAPTVMASIPLLVADHKLEGANGIVNGVQALSNVAAPVLGGVLYGMAGVETLITVSCIVFFVSGIMQMFIRIPFVQRGHEGHIVPTIFKDMKSGFIYVVKQPLILKSMILAALLNLVLTPFFVIGGPIILRVTMQSSDAMYGIGMGFIEFATILGALSVGIFAKKMMMKKLYRWLIGIAIMIIPMAVSVTPLMLSMGYYPAFLLFLLCAVVIAMIMTMIAIVVITIVQKRTPNENLGKVMAIITAVSQCAAPIGQLLCGVMFAAFSTKVYLTAVVISLVMFVISIAAKKMLQHEGETA